MKTVKMFDNKKLTVGGCSIISNIKPLYGVFKTQQGQSRSQYYSPKGTGKEVNIKWLSENYKKGVRKDV